MTKVTILHLSDLHYKGSKAEDQQIVINALKDDINELKDKQRIDVLIFSGDLVQAGNDVDHFKGAISDFLDPIVKSTGIEKTQLFVCPGNHDIDRRIVDQEDYIELGLLKKLRSRSEINEFIDKYIDVDIKEDGLPEAFSRVKNFYKSVWVPFAAEGDVLTPFHHVRKIEVNGIKIAICTFNSAWRCTGKPENADRGNLIIGERVVDHAIRQTQDVALRIAVFHHPFDWLVESDRTAVEARLHSDFHAFFYGHVHTVNPSLSNYHVGGAIYSQVGCLYHSRDYFNGYSVVELDLAASTATIQAREYTDRLRKFIPATGALSGGEVSFEFPFLKGAGGNNLMALLATVRPEIKRLGDEHVRLATDESVQVDLEQHFICPPLSKPKSMISEGVDSQPSADEELVVKDLLDTDQNIILTGSAESGKTSIIHYMALKAATSALTTPRLPLRAKFSDFQNSRSPVWKAVRPYANEISDGKITARMVGETPILLFVDEVSLDDSPQLELIAKLVGTEKHIKWVLVADDGKARAQSKEIRDALDQMLEVKIGELTRFNIRNLSAQWLNEGIDSEVANKVFTSVMDHISRSGLPRSGYIVSLMLWTIRKGLSGERINEAVLLENIIEFMLEKMDYRDALRAEFDFASKVAVLQELAIFFRSRTGSVSKNEIVTAVIEYLNRKGLKYDGGNIVNGLIKCGIFVEIGDTVEFRYRRFQEYFTAGYIRDNRSAYEEAVSSYAWEGYRREMDIYTSRFRSETSLLGEGRKKVDGIEFLKPSLTNEDLYAYLAEGNKILPNKDRLRRMKKQPMSARKIDEFRDKADASVTRRQTSVSTAKDKSDKLASALDFVASLEVYTNFIRNIEFADSTDKAIHLSHCFDLWELQARALLSGLYEVFNDIRDDIGVDPEISEDLKKDMALISQEIEAQAKVIIPRLISSEIYNALGTEKLGHLIEEVAKDAANTKLKRVLAAFVLLHVHPGKAMDLMSSRHWHESMNDQWVDGMVEGKIYQYYLEHHLVGSVRKQFEEFIAALESRAGTNKLNTDDLRSRYRMALDRRKRQIEIKENNRKK